MHDKLSAIVKSTLWGCLILIFPVFSGVLSVVFSLNTIATLFLQAIFMLAAILPPVFCVFFGAWSWSEIGFAPFDLKSCKKALYFIPVTAIFIPVAVQGFYIKSVDYVLGCFFLYFFVGIAEEIYFRGIVSKYLSKAFSVNGMILLSSLIFGIGHIAASLSGSSGIEVALSVLNALLFGWLAIEITVLSNNILPAILIHFFFDFETKIVIMSGDTLLLAEGIRGLLMFLTALWLFAVIIKREEPKEKEGLLD